MTLLHECERNDPEDALRHYWPKRHNMFYAAYFRARCRECIACIKEQRRDPEGYAERNPRSWIQDLAPNHHIDLTKLNDDRTRQDRLEDPVTIGRGEYDPLKSDGVHSYSKDPWL